MAKYLLDVNVLLALINRQPVFTLHPPCAKSESDLLWRRNIEIFANFSDQQIPDLRVSRNR